MWIPLTYPREGPIIFVNPTPSMYIKPGRYGNSETLFNLSFLDLSILAEEFFIHR